MGQSRDGVRVPGSTVWPHEQQLRVLTEQLALAVPRDTVVMERLARVWVEGQRPLTALGLGVGLLRSAGPDDARCARRNPVLLEVDVVALESGEFAAPDSAIRGTPMSRLNNLPRHRT